MTEHTPTPWGPDKYGQLRGANGVPVNTKALGLSQMLGGGEAPEAHANAAFILKAVNTHDALVAALVHAEAALDYLVRGADVVSSDRVAGAIHNVKATLAALPPDLTA